MSEIATFEQMAATEFEPWKHIADEWTPPGKDQWGKDGSGVLPCVRMAWILMYKTKAELETIVETLEEEPFEEMFDGILLTCPVGEVLVDTGISERRGSIIDPRRSTISVRFARALRLWP